MMTPDEKSSSGKSPASPFSLLRESGGFTYIELIMVIVMIGFLSSIIALKFVEVAETTEITAEGATIDLLRSNMINTIGEQLINGNAATFPINPFDNLTKIPQGYDRFRTTKPTGEPADDDIWVFVRGNQANAGGQITPQQAGTTLPTFRVDGFIYHQRRDSTVVRWAYDSSTGVISKRLIEKPSDLKRQRDFNARTRGETTRDQELQKTR
ncbi:MAG: type II secretion system protein [Candidatus Nitronauta litoralis]|uniref:Type II secretion system protein n=1 Tax=Candidatus Nitronauta litoralis TaxID=2705533 RepID=A0A7T0BUM7_9BACT|nr:MAG: type II secretion system protein [Candidatus Nitronauta litoralis]